MINPAPRLLVPKLRLGNGAMSAKLRFERIDGSHAGAAKKARPTKRSFADKCVTKLELGNEGRKPNVGMSLPLSSQLSGIEHWTLEVGRWTFCLV
jgi:hypothetical protein